MRGYGGNEGVWGRAWAGAGLGTRCQRVGDAAGTAATGAEAGVAEGEWEP